MKAPPLWWFLGRTVRFLGLVLFRFVAFVVCLVLLGHKYDGQKRTARCGCEWRETCLRCAYKPKTETCYPHGV